MLIAALAWLGLINLAAFVAFALDKRYAVEGWRRIPERTLLQLAFLGGSAGAIAAQQLLRHKTRKEPFRTHLLLIVLVQMIVAVALLVPEARAFIGGLIVID